MMKTSLGRINVWAAAALFGAAAFLCFFLAAATWPGGGYNPFTTMLSSLGRTVVKGVELPVCRYLFMAGMWFAALGVATAFWPLRTGFGGWRRRAVGFGAISTAAGLVVISLIAENVNQLGHNVGCWLAVAGGSALLLAFDRRGRDRAWTCALAAACGVFTAIFCLHAARVIPFAPYFPSAQKVLIVLFAIWTGDVARRNGRPMRTWCRIALVLMALIAASIAALLFGMAFSKQACQPGGIQSSNANQPRSVPFTDDERAALKWIEHVIGALPPEEEREWWNVGGALNLVYHVKSGLFYPRGHNGLDGWSLLWYEPWAADRASALSLWREASKRIDWQVLESGADARRGKDTCCDPVDVPPVASATFLAAAARACDDAATAERLEKLADRALVRRDGMLYLDVGRDWRIGATANRIVALAESNGFRFRDMVANR